MNSALGTCKKLIIKLTTSTGLRSRAKKLRRNVWADLQQIVCVFTGAALQPDWEATGPVCGSHLFSSPASLGLPPLHIPDISKIGSSDSRAWIPVSSTNIHHFTEMGKTNLVTVIFATLKVLTRFEVVKTYLARYAWWVSIGRLRCCAPCRDCCT